ncbi:MAG TPA: hypothetical protein VMT20_29095 [Terriglobia bacterium]|nr:hypothetical protein [Terriglobia bacterium]
MESDQLRVHFGPVDVRLDLQLALELFVLLNLIALGFDIFLAHSENQFRRGAEYFPVYFEAAGSLLLLLGIVSKEVWHRAAVWRDLGYLVGWVSVVTGLVGVIYHLDSQFFYERTLRSLTYAAPFAAPLALTGVGLLLILNRMVAPGSREWAEWVLLLTAGGFFGNFGLSLADHASNGFFRPVEWLPVVTAAFAVSFLVVPFLVPVTRRYLALCAAVLLVQAAVGALGFLLHNLANLRGPSSSIFEKFTTGAPAMAPLLFVNLALLGWLGLWALSRCLGAGESQPAN